MGKDHDLLQAVKDNDGSAIHKILQKLGKASKSSELTFPSFFNYSVSLCPRISVRGTVYSAGFRVLVSLLCFYRLSVTISVETFKPTVTERNLH